MKTRTVTATIKLVINPDDAEEMDRLDRTDDELAQYVKDELWEMLQGYILEGNFKEFDELVHVLIETNITVDKKS